MTGMKIIYSAIKEMIMSDSRQKEKGKRKTY
jgi:hypothetical protein